MSDSSTPQWDRRAPDDDEDDVTSAFDLPVSAHALRRGAEAVQRHGRDPDAPLTIAEADALLRALTRKLRDEQTTSRQESSRELRELLNRPPRKQAERLAADLQSMRADYRFVKRIAVGVGAPLLAFGLWAAREMITSSYARAERDATIDLRIQRLEQQELRLETRLFSTGQP